MKNIDLKKYLPMVKIAAIAAASFVVYRWAKKKGLFLSKFEKEGEINIGESFTNKAIEEAKNQSTHTESELRQIASKIKNSFGFFNDDEKQVYEAFRQINNYADLMLVIRYFGVYTRFGTSYALEDCIAQFMNAKERGKINEILNNKGIDFNF